MPVKTAFDYTTRNGTIVPKYRCGINGLTVNVYKHGVRFAITTLIGDFEKHAVKCKPCAALVSIPTE